MGVIVGNSSYNTYTILYINGVAYEKIIPILMYAALKKANNRLGDKLSAGKRSTDKELAGLSWTVDELGRLITMGRDVCLEIDSMLSILEDQTSDLVQRNSARRTVKIRDDVLSVIQR